MTTGFGASDPATLCVILYALLTPTYFSQLSELEAIDSLVQGIRADSFLRQSWRNGPLSGTPLTRMRYLFADERSRTLQWPQSAG